MITHVYKNNNFTVKFEPRYDDALPKTLPELVERINNDIDAPDAVNFEESYPGYLATFFVNGAPRYYMVVQSHLEEFLDGRTVRFRYDCDAPLFALPSHYDSHRIEYQGRKGTLYKLCDLEIDGDRITEMSSCGCTPFIVQSEYAPEQVHIGIFVPDGTCFEFE